MQLHPCSPTSRFMPSILPRLLSPLVLACLISAAPARAGDGVLEINQTCAVQTGCFAGDAPGYPVTITAAGSYRLTSNLVVGGADVSGIQIPVDRVRLDLGGFELAGTGSCTGNGASLVCSGAGNSFGIIATGSGANVRNGSVRGFGISGVALNGGQGLSLKVEQNGSTGFSGNGAYQVVADRNAGIGIQLSEGIARDCIATRNAGVGISVFSSRIVDSVASANGQTGISAQQASVVSDSVSRTNATQGIVSTGGVVRNNAVELNGADGIVGNSGTLVVGNTSRSNAQAGIAALSSGSVVDNVSRSNVGYGLYLFPEQGGPAAAYRGNVVFGTTTVVNGIDMGDNSCNGTQTCP